MPKIYVAYPKDGESESSELKALGLRFNKAEPSRVGFIGLRRLEQPGYESYIHHLAGFMQANDTRERQNLSKVGFPIKLPFSKCFPLLQPPLHIKVKQPDAEKGEAIFSKFGIEYQKGKQKTGKDDFTIFTVSECISALAPIRDIGQERSHSPAGQVSFDGLLAFLLAKRIFSSFFRTHNYPAYSAPTEIEDYSGLKRRIDEESSGGTKRVRTEKVDGAGSSEAMAIDSDAPVESYAVEKVVLRFAKPSDETILPWGTTLGDIPNIHGIVFPFILQLSNWDKDMVPIVMEQHFLRCFGKDDTAISSAFSKFVESWKSEVYSTQAGIILSHMAKIISIALPAQARPFPIFEGDQYRGCYLSGANFSVALKSNLIRPEPFTENKQYLSELFGKYRLVNWMKDRVLAKEDEDEFADQDFQSLRSIVTFLKSVSTTIDIGDIQQARAFAANANFPTQYLPVTVDNVSRAIKSAIEGVALDDTPIHHEAFGSEDPFEINLSAFGPGVPSPHIPGGKELTSFKVAPTQSTACFRRCQLRSAVVEWKDVIEKGVVRNEPRNLNAKFQFVKIAGSAEKVKWYQMMDQVISIGREKAQNKDFKSGAESTSKKTDGSGAVSDLFDF